MSTPLWKVSRLTYSEENIIGIFKPNHSTQNIVTNDRIANNNLAWTLRIPSGSVSIFEIVVEPNNF
jgi:hypothetical protein